jgi:hypothetical protein
MTPAELMVITRRLLNDEVSATYKWTVAELIDYFNFTMDDISRDTGYFLDSYTAAVAEIAVVAGTPSYACSALINDIKRVYYNEDNAELDFYTVEDLTNENSHWMYSNGVYGTDISFADSNPDTIISTTTDFIAEGFVADEWIQINGCATAANNKNVQIDTVAQYLITLKSTNTLTTRVAGDPISLRTLNTGDPTAYTLGYRTGYITLSPCPDAAGAIFLDTSRYQLTPLTIATLGSLTIPLEPNYHLSLVDGICKYAYLKSGPSTFNIEKSKIHEGRFLALERDLKKNLINSRSSRKPATPHEGNI